MTRRLPSAATVHRIVRRTHMYLGLLLLPWILLFGLSGILFNHPNFGEKMEGRFVPPPVLRQQTGIAPWDAAALAKRIAGTLGERAGEALEVDPEFRPRFSGYGIYRARDATGQTTVILEPNRGAAIVASRAARAEEPEPAFAKEPLPIEEVAPAAVEEQLTALQRTDGRGALEAHPEAAPRLEFRLRGEGGRRFNVVYHTASGELGVRDAAIFPSIGPSQLLTTLHMTHHFTMGLSGRWFWALFQDLLGVAMVLWAITGTYLWWKVQPSRVFGSVAVAIAFAVGAWVMLETSSEVFFGPVPQTLGPGD